MLPFSPEMNRAIQRCTADIMADKPQIETTKSMKQWARRWRKREVELFNMGGMYGSLNWSALKESSERLGLWDESYDYWWEKVIDRTLVPIFDFIERVTSRGRRACVPHGSQTEVAERTTPPKEN